jgi:hypothetical protein
MSQTLPDGNGRYGRHVRHVAAGGGNDYCGRDVRNVAEMATGSTASCPKMLPRDVATAACGPAETLPRWQWALRRDVRNVAAGCDNAACGRHVGNVAVMATGAAGVLQCSRK